MFRSEQLAFAFVRGPLAELLFQAGPRFYPARDPCIDFMLCELGFQFRHHDLKELIHPIVRFVIFVDAFEHHLSR
jgi:hypothetical protein